MNAERLLQLYGRVSEAPDAIPRLRKFILDLAVRGKLVEQDPSDEPAEELGERVSGEISRLITAGLARNPRQFPPLVPEELPFELPPGWAWSQISRIGLLSPRNDAEDDLVASFVPMPNISADYGVSNNHEPRLWSEIKKGYTHFAEGDVGLAKITPCFENGKSTVFRNLTGGIGSGTTELHIVRPFFVSPDYIVAFLKSPFFIGNGIPRMTGTAGQKRVPLEYFAASPFPLPPLEEQHRIVAKVDELMALCDSLEAERKKREATRDRLTAASLSRLATPDVDEKQFKAHADFAIRVLPELTARPDQIKLLRQTVLDLAVRGKLVEQDPTDEPASDVLSCKFSLPEGYSRRRKMFKEGHGLSSNATSGEIPKSWRYVDIQTLYERNIIIDFADGNHGALYPRSSEFGSSGVLFVSARDLRNGKVNWESCARLNERRAEQLKKGWAQSGDVLLTHNATVGRVAQVKEDVEPFLLGTSVTFYRLNPSVLSPDFFFYLLRSSVWQNQLAAIMEQTTRNQVSIQKQAFFFVPFPPLPEQHRIVAKTDELMSLCEKLERGLNSGQKTRSGLLEALLVEALDTVTMEAA